jgi:surface protein
MSQMFSMPQPGSIFNQPLNGWGSKTSKVKNMYSMFFSCEALAKIPNIEQWDVSGVTDMSQMFWMQEPNGKFNQPLNGWGSKTHSVTNMSYMFSGAVAFNQPLRNWDVSSVTDMTFMFTEASSFNQVLGSWNLKSIGSFGSGFTQLSGMYGILENSGIDCSHYTGTLQGWAKGLATGATPSGPTTPPGSFLLGPVGSANLYDQSLNNPGGAYTLLTAAGWSITPSSGGACPSTLPINLQSFTVKPQNNTALLKWTTASETNNKGFGIQRSADGATWADLTFINSAASRGNSSVKINYQYTDNRPLAGDNYYRLKQMDLDGAASYSDVQGVNFSNLPTAMQVSPNPANKHIKISNLPANATVRIVSMNGSVYTLPVNNGNINISSLPAGVYFAEVVVSNSIIGKLKFVKQ